MEVFGNVVRVGAGEGGRMRGGSEDEGRGGEWRSWIQFERCGASGL